MRVTVGGPTSEIEAEALKKYIKEKEIKESLSNQTSKQELNRVKHKLKDLISFYDRLIKSINLTLESVKKKTQLTYKEKKDLYYVKQERELYQAKKERAKFRKYMNEINKKIDLIK